MIKKKELNINVLDAAKERIIKVFNDTDNTIRLSFSGGKDSIVLADIVYNLCLQDKIDSKRLIVSFIDEEAMFEDVIDIVKKWRKKFIMIGAKFMWFCMQYKHFNCLNSLEQNETFICWDETKKDVWVREKPDFAISSHELLVDRKDNYQAFLSKLDAKNAYISMTGVRVAESVQRLMNMSVMKTSISGNSFFPIYDWTDDDVWFYIYTNNVEIPKVYENLYRVMTSKRNLRISQFFSIDTARVLVKLGELYPDLMERVTRREPNAYLCCLYWDTEMFGRSTRTRKELDTEKKDYKKLLFSIFNGDKTQFSENQLELIKIFKSIIVDEAICYLDEVIYEQMYSCIITGDPKKRKTRSIIMKVRGEKRK